MKKTLVFLITLLLITGCGCKKEINNKTSIKDEKATSDVKVEEIIFTNIKFEYESGITTLTGKITNKTNKMQSFTAIIVLKDKNGKKVKELKQVIEKLAGGSYQILSTGIIGDYSSIKDVEFSIENLGE